MPFNHLLYLLRFFFGIFRKSLPLLGFNESYPFHVLTRIYMFTIIVNPDAELIWKLIKSCNWARIAPCDLRVPSPLLYHWATWILMRLSLISLSTEETSTSGLAWDHLAIALHKKIYYFSLSFDLIIFRFSMIFSIFWTSFFWLFFRSYNFFDFNYFRFQYFI